MSAHCENTSEGKGTEPLPVTPQWEPAPRQGTASPVWLTLSKILNFGVFYLLILTRAVCVTSNYHCGDVIYIST